MTGIDSYSTTPATNANCDAGAINWQEGMPPSSVNNSARQGLADTRSAFNDLVWFQYGSGDQGAGNIAVPCVYASSTSFTIAGVDVTSAWHIGRRIRAVGVSTGTIYGVITNSAFATNTTVTAAWDAGSLSNETLVISLSQVPMTGDPTPGRIRFPATQIASSNANTLDDYEEGSWTPTVGGTSAYNSASGFYTKVGRIITATMAMDISTIGSGSATTITGLPYTASNAGPDYAGSCSFFANSATNFVSLVPYVGNNSATISFACLTAAAGSMTLAPNIFQNTTQIKLTVTYLAAA